jgi:hypothetical protein
VTKERSPSGLAQPASRRRESKDRVFMIRLFGSALGVDFEPGAEREGGLAGAITGGGQVIGIGDLGLRE